MDELRETRTPKKSKTFDYIVRFTCYLLILLPAALGVLYVRAFGVSVVLLDAWSVVTLFEKWSSGTLHLSDLFAQHNEHRMFFPKGVELLLGSITKYDNVAEMYLIQVCFLVTLVVLFLAFRDNIRSSWLFLFVPVAFLVFSFRQYENMLFGFQINFAFAQTFSVLALFLLYVVGRKRFKKSAFVAALGSGTVASFSVAQGLFVWPVGLLQLFISPLEKPTKRIFVVLWGLVGLGVWVSYFADYTRPGHAHSLLYALNHPVEGAEYFLDLLGSSLFWEPIPALVGGLLLACLAVVSLLLLYRDRRLGEYSFWISLLLYSFLVLASITLGRSAFGIGEAVAGQALASRYTSFSILAVVSMYAMLVKTVFERRSSINTVLLVALSGVMLLSVAVSYSEGIKVGTKEKVSRENAAFVLYTYESQPVELLSRNLHPLDPLARSVTRRAPTLQELGYNVFSEQQAPDLPPPPSTLSPVASSTSFGISTLSTDAESGVQAGQQNRSVVVPQEASFIELKGWAVDTSNESTAGGVYIDIDGKLFPAFYGTLRDDVADHFGVPAYRYSGFERAIPVSEIGAGSHELAIVVLTSDRKGYYRPDQKMVLEVR